LRNKKPHRVRVAIRLSALVVLAGLAAAGEARASESAASFYLLGTGGPGAAVLPPVPGVFLSNTLYHYDGKAGGGRRFVVGGNLVAGLKANINANFASVVWVPSTDVAAATLMVGLLLPAGVPAVDVDAVLTGPRGRSALISREDDRLVMGDPVLTSAMSWRTGDVWIEASGLLNVPIGRYDTDRLSNLS